MQLRTESYKGDNKGYGIEQLFIGRVSLWGNFESLTMARESVNVMTIRARYRR